MMENEGATPVETNVETTQTPEASPESSPPPAAPAEESGVAHETSDAQPVDQNQNQNQTQPAPQAQPGEAREQTHRPSRVDRRNAKLSNENRELRERLARLEGRLDSQQPRSEPAQAQGDPEPDPKNYPQGEYDPKYLRDAARWDYRQEAKSQAAERERSESESKSREEFMANAQRFHNTIQQAEDSDFIEGGDLLMALDKAGKRDLIDDITDSDNAAALAQWLAVPKSEPKQEAYRRSVLGMTGRKRVRELSRIDDYLTDYFKAQRNHTARPAQPAAAPSSPSAQSTPSTPKPVPQPAPIANGKGSGGVAPNGSARALDGLYDR